MMLLGFAGLGYAGIAGQGRAAQRSSLSSEYALTLVRITTQHICYKPESGTHISMGASNGNKRAITTPPPGLFPPRGGPIGGAGFVMTVRQWG
jgi:hypothetical protein